MKFRSLSGPHNEVLTPRRLNQEGVLAFRTFEQGQTIDTENDLCKLNVEGFKPKFERLHEAEKAEMPLTAHVFDSAKETIDQFVARMQGSQVTAQAAALAPSQAASPSLNPVAQAAKQGFETIHTDSGRSPLPRSDKGEGHPFRSTDKPLEQLTLDELRRVAEDNELNVAKCRTKEDFVREIKKALVTI